MAGTAITPQRPTSTGLTLITEAANAAGNTYPFRVHNVLLVTNGSAASINVTIQTPGSADNDLALPDRIVVVPAGATRYLCPTDAVYRQADGTVQLLYSAVATVSVAVLTTA